MKAKNVYENLKCMMMELNGYKERKIFTPQEIQKILMTRKKYELKLQRLKKNISDYTNYIRYECKLLKSRNQRMLKNNILEQETDINLEKNILRIYKKAFSLFTDIDIVQSFGEFCIKIRFKIDIYEEMKECFRIQLLKNPKDEKLWIFCSNKFWEIEDIESARNTLIKGIHIVDNPSQLYVTFFKLEVEYANKLSRLNYEMGIDTKDYGKIEKGEIAIEFFKEIAQKFTNIEIQQCLKISKILPGLNEELKKLLAN